MSDKSKIEWTDETWNPIVGCSKISPGCKNCYAERMAGRLAAMGQRAYQDVVNSPDLRYGPKCTWNGQTRFVESALTDPFHWRKPRKIFVCSMSDLLHPTVTAEMWETVQRAMCSAPWNKYQILTKRPERLSEFAENYTRWSGEQMPDNWWVGTTVEDAERKSRLDALRKCPAAVRFISAEPLLSDLGRMNLDGIHWVIAGGESGPNARPMHPDWARSLRDQCQAAGVPFFFKQWGEWHTGADDLRTAAWDSKINKGVCPCGSQHDMFSAAAGTHRLRDRCGMDAMSMYRVGKKLAGRLLDGVEHNEFPNT